MQVVRIEHKPEVCLRLVRTEGWSGWSNDGDRFADEPPPAGLLGPIGALLSICSIDRIRLDTAYAPRYTPGACHLAVAPLILVALLDLVRIDEYITCSIAQTERPLSGAQRTC